MNSLSWSIQSANCQALGLSRSGYYHWLKRPESSRVKANRELLNKISVLDEGNRHCYGIARESLTPCLGRLIIGKSRVARLMSLHRIRVNQLDEVLGGGHHL